MRINKTWKKQSDWIILVAVVSIGLSTILLVSMFLRHERIEPVSRIDNYQTYDPYTSGIYEQKPPSPNYPAPQGAQASYYRDYQVSDFTLSIDKGELNVDRAPYIGDNTVIVSLYNPFNKTITLNQDQLRATTVGCVAMDKPYHMTEVKLTNLTLKPYEKRTTTLKLSIDCIYIGTADHKYFWTIY